MTAAPRITTALESLIQEYKQSEAKLEERSRSYEQSLHRVADQLAPMIERQTTAAATRLAAFESQLKKGLEDIHSALKSRPTPDVSHHVSALKSLSDEIGGIKQSLSTLQDTIKSWTPPPPATPSAQDPSERPQGPPASLPFAGLPETDRAESLAREILRRLASTPDFAPADSLPPRSPEIMDLMQQFNTLLTTSLNERQQYVAAARSEIEMKNREIQALTQSIKAAWKAANSRSSGATSPEPSHDRP